MGHARKWPRLLASKLLQIRQNLGLSQPKLAKVLGVREYTDLSKWERNVLEPPLHVLLRYAQVGQISVESLIDDQVDLPERKATE